MLAAARAVLAERAGLVARLPASSPTRDLGPPPVTGPARLLVAARAGTTRLIDNTRRSTLRRPRMMRTMLKSKIHRATVTQADLHYVGSVTIDEDLLDAADLLPGEQVAIVDVTNGARLETYVIPGERGSGVIGINGAAAHLVHPGDLVILISYGVMDDDRGEELPAGVVHVDAANRVVELGADPAAPAAGMTGACVRERHRSMRDAALDGSRGRPAAAAAAAPPPGWDAGRRRLSSSAPASPASACALHAARGRPARSPSSPRSRVDDGSTRWAQGGIAAGARPGRHARGARRATRRRRRRAVRRRPPSRRWSPRGPARLRQLIALGRRVRPGPRRRAAAHPRGRPLARDRIVHAGGDATGAEVQRALHRAPSHADPRHHAGRARDGARPAHATPPAAPPG